MWKGFCPLGLVFLGNNSSDFATVQKRLYLRLFARHFYSPRFDTYYKQNKVEKPQNKYFSIFNKNDLNIKAFLKILKSQSIR